MPTLFRIATAACFAMLFVLLTGCNGARDTALNLVDSAPDGTGFHIKHLNGHGRAYGLFVPRGYNPSQSYPMIVFLHGVGEGGSDAKAPLRVGLAPFVADHADSFPFFVLFPQSTGGWDENSSDTADAIAAIHEVESTYKVDANRVYLTGLSTGGYGTFAIAATYPNEFAAIVPMCPSGGAAHHAKTLASMGMPIWAVENAADPFVAPMSMGSTLGAIESNGGKVKHTVYPAFGHDCWDAAYGDGEIFQWMLSHRRGGNGAASPAPAPGPSSKSNVTPPAAPVAAAASPAVTSAAATPSPKPALVPAPAPSATPSSNANRPGMPPPPVW